MMRASTERQLCTPGNRRSKSRPPPATTCSCIKNATSLAQSGPLQDVPGSGMPHPRSAPCHRTRHLYRSLDGRLSFHRDTTRCASSIFDYKCAGSCIENSTCNRHQIGFRSQSEGPTKIILRLLQLRATRKPCIPDIEEPPVADSVRGKSGFRFP